MNKITSDNRVCFELNLADYSAKIVYSPDAKYDVTIPRSIMYQEKEFVIKSITEGSFKDNKQLKSINFPEDSSLTTIEKNSFKSSNLKSLFIPSSVKELQEGWCNKTSELDQVTISPNNEYFTLNDEHQLILRRNDKEAQNFEYLVFANRNIEHVKIPSNIKYIESYAFDKCYKLKTIDIQEDSELLSIGKNSFRSLWVNSFYIPSKVEKIHEVTNVDGIFTEKILLSLENKNFKYLDDEMQVIIGKSDINNDEFDSIVYCNIYADIETLIVPDSIKYINPFAFCCREKLKEITFSANSKLQVIGKYAFSFSKIEKINIPNSVTTIGENAFEYSKIEKINIPNSVTTIGENAFSSTKIEKIIIPNSVTTIGENAFSSKKIEKIIIPNSVTTIGKFGNNYTLKTVIFEEGSKLQEIPESLFDKCFKINYIEIPEDSDIRVIGKNAFASTRITSLYIPSKIEKIDDGAFKDTTVLTEIIISPENPHFTYMDQSRQIIVGKSDNDNELFDTIIFASRDITSVTIPKCIKHIKSYAFNSCCKLNKVIIPKDSELRTIGDESFSSTSIDCIFIPSKVEKISKECFIDVSTLNRIFISPKNKHFKAADENSQIIITKSDINTDDFDVLLIAAHNIKYAIIPASIKYINSYAFYSTALKAVEFQENSQIKSIGKNAFEYSFIREFKLPKNVETIGEYAFYYCNNLELFEIEEGSKLTVIPKYLISNCRHLKTVKIPEDCNIKKIEKYAFYKSSIESLYIPSKVEYFEDDWCADLKRLTISPKSACLKYNDEKNQVILKKNEYGNFDDIFFANKDIKHIKIISSIKKICSGAFKNCTKLKTVVFEENSELNSIGSDAFRSTSIKRITIPENVYTIYYDAFSDCHNLEYFEYPGQKSYLYLNFLKNCDHLKLASFPNVDKIDFCLKNLSKDLLLFVSAGIEINVENL